MSATLAMTQRATDTMRWVPMFVREHTRYPVELAVRMKCSSWSDYLDLHATNLSRGGLFVPSLMSAPIGTEIWIELSLPNATLVKMRGEVVHLKEAARDQPAGIGVMFLGVDGDATRALDEALRLARASAPRPLPVMKAMPPPIPIKPATVAKPAAVAARATVAVPAPLPLPLPLATAPTSDDGWAVPAAAAPDARAPRFSDAVEQALLDELGRRLELTPQQQLGVASDAADADIAEAYGRLKERYAPAIFARYGASTAAVLRSINEAIDAAHHKLQDPSERRALLAHQPNASELSPVELEQKRRGEEARAALRAGIERRVQEACVHRDLSRLDDAIRTFEQVLNLDRKHEYARGELAKLRDLKAKRKR